MSIERLVMIVAVVVFGLSSSARSDAPPAPVATVSQSGGHWLISGKKQTVTLDPKTLAIDVKVPFGAGQDLVVARVNEAHLLVGRRLEHGEARAWQARLAD